jgi:hypothetical protein
MISLGLDSEDAAQRARWRDALLLYGERFAAYTQLRPAALHTPDVIEDYLQRFVAAYDSVENAARAPLGTLETDGTLERFEDEHGLKHGTMSWDYDALELFLRSGYDVVERESGVYVFHKDSSPKPESVEGLGVHTEDPELLARWREGTEKWGDAFLAFASLHLPELHSTDVLSSFEQTHVASFDSIVDLASYQIEALGWKDAFARFRRDEGISSVFLEWNHQAIVKQLELVCDVVWLGGRGHAFWK